MNGMEGFGIMDCGKFGDYLEPPNGGNDHDLIVAIATAITVIIAVAVLWWLA